MLTLQNLVELLPHSHLYPGPDASLQAAVVAVCADSRQVNTGALFVATIGAQHDGHRYVAAAIARGNGEYPRRAPASKQPLTTASCRRLAAELLTNLSPVSTQSAPPVRPFRLDRGVECRQLITKLREAL